MVNLIDIEQKDFEKFDFNGICCPCKIINIYDGDTCTGGIEWNNKYIQLRFRLKGINSAEIRPPKNAINRDKIIENAYLAKKKLFEYCTDKIPDNCRLKKECDKITKVNKKIIYVKMYNFDAFGRVVSELYLDPEYKYSINELMVDSGNAVKFNKYI
jgi:hypothetical protein